MTLEEKVVELEAEVCALRKENARLLSDPGRNIPGRSTRQSKESKLAALRAMPKTGSQREVILSLLHDVFPGGMSDEEVHGKTRYDIRICSTRRKDIEEGGWGVKAPCDTRARSGNEGAVWVLSSTAIQTLGGWNYRLT